MFKVLHGTIDANKPLLYNEFFANSTIKVIIKAISCAIFQVIYLVEKHTDIKEVTHQKSDLGIWTQTESIQFVNESFSSDLGTGSIESLNYQNNNITAVISVCFPTYLLCNFKRLEI